jgi:hypothetical protein
VRTVRRVVVTAVGLAALLLTSGGTAWAHMCYNASRSAQGNAGASNSQVWSTESVVAFAHTGELFPAEIADCFLSHWFAGGGPEFFTTHLKGAYGSDQVLAGRAPTKVLGDGHGIDNDFVVYGDLFASSIDACTG